MITLGYGIVVLYALALGGALLGALRFGSSLARSRSAATFVLLWGAAASLVALVGLEGILHIFYGRSLVPYLVHLHPTKGHLHYAVETAHAATTVCHHLPLLDLELPHHTYLLPALWLGLPIASLAANQLYLRRLDGRVRTLRDRDLSESLTQAAGDTWRGSTWDLVVVESPEPEVLSYALLSPSLRERRLARDVVVVSKRVLHLLDCDEIAASVDHEIAHLESKDNRYVAFLRTLRRLVFFDPVVALVGRQLVRRAELSADDRAAKLSEDPEALARALFKTHLEDRDRGDGEAKTIRQAHTGRLLVERIDRLTSGA